jgi:molecular chaperone Hsp33
MDSFLDRGLAFKKETSINCIPIEEVLKNFQNKVELLKKEKLENNLKDLQPVSAMVNEGLDGKGIIKNVLKGFEDIHFLTTTDLSFKCQCSKIRTEDILVTLGHDDLQAMVNEGHAEVVCQFCGEKYQFNKEDLTVILHVSDELRRRKAKAEKEKK